MKKLRNNYHERIFNDILGYRKNKKGELTSCLSNADASSKASMSLASGIADIINLPLCKNLPEGQQAGSLFTQYTKDFLDASFKLIHHLRPGKWLLSTSQAKIGIASFHQYEHLAVLNDVLAHHKELKAAIGSDYLITPDIIVSRSPVEDIGINKIAKPESIVIAKGDDLAKLTPFRSKNINNDCSLLHASISCKWTMRSDRAQNTRTEALNLVRNRKGRTPCIVAVTFEPLPSRIASIALGTGDIDCTYHGALYELLEAAKISDHDDSLEMLNILVKGRRLRDISDLPFDLAI
jgi:hypothetical protein